MVELKVNDEIHFINPNEICFVSLGDGSLPSERALSVTIYFTKGYLEFHTNSGAESKKLYERIKKLINEGK